MIGPFPSIPPDSRGESQYVLSSPQLDDIMCHDGGVLRNARDQAIRHHGALDFVPLAPLNQASLAGRSTGTLRAESA